MMLEVVLAVVVMISRRSYRAQYIWGIKWRRLLRGRLKRMRSEEIRKKE